MGSVTEINGLPLPLHLLVLIEAGRWKSPSNPEVLDRLFPGRGDFSLYTLDYMPFENKWWIEKTHEYMPGTPDESTPPGDIDSRLSVLIGDLGLGLDQPIALDYRISREKPRVLLYKWSFQRDGSGNRWVEIAPTIERFAEMLSL